MGGPYEVHFKFNFCILRDYYPAVIYLFKVSNSNTKSKREQSLQINLVFPLLTLNKKILAGYIHHDNFQLSNYCKLVAVINIF